jgi:hypothetical protein
MPSSTRIRESIVPIMKKKAKEFTEGLKLVTNEFEYGVDSSPRCSLDSTGAIPIAVCGWHLR